MTTSQSLQPDTRPATGAAFGHRCSASGQLQTARQAGKRVSIPIWKRLLDITLILVASPVVLPLGCLIAVAIKLVSRGPVFFTQERIGFLGRPFKLLKFRTMVANADTGVHQGHLTRLMSANCPMTKLDAEGDPRVIPGGWLLRSYGLDELPQLINVLRGEMSLVGPRPCLVYEYEGYLPRHRPRCETLPGLTGLWQVSGKNRTTFEEMIALDIYYVKCKSLLLDLKIIALTIPSILMQVCELKLRRKLAAMESANGGSKAGESSESRY